MRRTFLLLTLVFFFGTSATPVQAEGGGVQVEDVQIQHDFGQQITFLAHVVSETPIESVTLFFRQERGENTNAVSLQPDEAGNLRYTYDTSTQVLPPFVPILFWYQIKTQSGESFESLRYRFIYTDNRFPWQAREENGIVLHWYDGDDAFVREALDSARVGAEAMREIFPVEDTTPIDIYVYNSSSELQSALFLGGESWMAGEANPALGVVLVAIPPGPQQGIMMKRLIPHELAHVLLYRRLGESYNRLPTWLQEGIPSIMELYPNPDYPRALDAAKENETLFPISALCDAFPRDASGAFLAYAEAESFTRYLRETYGDSGMNALIDAYADGLDCEQGAARALGVSLHQLDMRWREDVLGENVLGVAFRNLLPYLFLLLLLLTIPLWNGVKAWRKRETK